MGGEMELDPGENGYEKGKTLRREKRRLP